MIKSVICSRDAAMGIVSENIDKLTISRKNDIIFFYRQPFNIVVGIYSTCSSRLTINL